MYRATRRTVTLSLLAALAACGSPKSRFKTYNGPPVTQIVVNKGARRMYLLHDTTVLKSYDISLGNEPIGHKQFEGDGKTPEGIYFIDRFNPRSEYHLSVGVSYPNEQDKEYAEKLGLSPGGDIFIHGRGPRVQNPPRDWTRGCAAVTDQDMAEIFGLVRPGTPIFIKP